MKVKSPVQIIGYENKESKKDGTTWCTVYCSTEEIEENGKGNKVTAYSLHKKGEFEIGEIYNAVYETSTFNGVTTLRCVDIEM